MQGDFQYLSPGFTIILEGGAMAFKSLNVLQLQKWCELLKTSLIGAQLQQVWSYEEGIVLKIYLRAEYYLILDLNQSQPALVFTEQEPKFKKAPKPTALFLNSHAKNFRLVDLFVEQDKGRVVQISFAANLETKTNLQLRLIPRQANLEVEAGSKKVSFYRPSELSTAMGTTDGLSDEFDPQAYLAEWYGTRFKQSTGKDPLELQQKQIDKKRRAIDALKIEMSGENSKALREYAQALQVGQELPAAPEKYKTLLTESNLTKFELAEECFRVAKQLEQKNVVRAQRLLGLEQELLSLEEAQAQGRSLGIRQSDEGKKGLQLSQKVGAEARKLELGEATAYIGKSAKDNLLILRNAQAWDMWVHLRDYPSAHAVIKRNKSYQISDQELKKVGQWLIKESLKAKAAPGDKYDVIFAECRFVKPIKGDKLGRVTFKNEKTLRLTY